MDTIEISKAGIALLAFVLAFYGLTARERKTPYITGTVYSAVIFVLLIIFIDLLSKFCMPVYPTIAAIMQTIAIVSFFLSLCYVIYKICNIYVRHMNFRDDQLWNVPLVRKFKEWKNDKSSRKAKEFEHYPTGIDEALVDKIGKGESIPADKLREAVERNSFAPEIKLSISTVYIASNWIKAEEIIAKLAIDFIDCGNYVQYTTSARHPIEFILYLKKKYELFSKEKQRKSWEEVNKNIVVVDAYTPHYGFTDSIHAAWTRKINKEIGVRCITSHPSYAGIHTSAAEAFNIIKRYSKDNIRRPILLIYEGLYGIVDLESVEQYRIFIRHLLPSEKIWGGMYTFLVESNIPDTELALMRSYADIFEKIEDK